MCHVPVMPVQEEGSDPLHVQLQVLESIYTFAAGKLHTFKVSTATSSSSWSVFVPFSCGNIHTLVQAGARLGCASVFVRVLEWVGVHTQVP